MESKFQTSFIPKKSLEDTGKVKVKTPFNIFSLVSTLLITITILVSVVAFGYSYILNKDINTARQELVDKERKFDYSAVDEIVRVDNKLQASANLLGSHTAITGVFKYLEEATLKNLQFSSFDFSALSPSRVSISMKGKARSFGAVARQAELFTASTASRGVYFTDPVFSDLDLDDKGNVNFSFISSVDPRIISYKENLPSGQDTPAPAVIVPASTSTSTSTNSNTQQHI